MLYPTELRNQIGASGGTRTPDSLIRSQILYPTELRMQIGAGETSTLGHSHFKFGPIGRDPKTPSLCPVRKSSADNSRLNDRSLVGGKGIEPSQELQSGAKEFIKLS